MSETTSIIRMLVQTNVANISSILLLFPINSNDYKNIMVFRRTNPILLQWGIKPTYTDSSTHMQLQLSVSVYCGNWFECSHNKMPTTFYIYAFCVEYKCDYDTFVPKFNILAGNMKVFFVCATTIKGANFQVYVSLESEH